MGTRGLTIVVENSKNRIAQYGQWDHNPSGQGFTALDFCHKQLATNDGRAAFKTKLNNIRFVDDAEFKQLWKNVGVDLDKSHGMVDMD